MFTQIKALASEQEMLIASNKSLAEYNLAREPAYRQTREMLLESHKDASELKKEVELKRSKLDELTRQTSLDTTLALLQTANAEADEESERIAESFLAGEVPLDSFLGSFLDKRKRAHLRRIKTDKLVEYIRNQSNQTESGSGPMRPAPPPPASLPYPIQSAMMPQPGYNANNFPFSRPF